MKRREAQGRLIGSIGGGVLLLLAVLMVTGICSPVNARPTVDEAKILQMSQEAERLYHERRGPAFDAYVEEHGLQQYVNNVHNGMELMGLTEWGEPIWNQIDNANAAHSIKVDLVYPDGGYGYNLTGFFTQYLCMWDADNVLETHQEFNDGLSRVSNGNPGGSTHYHATHVAGTMVAGGVNTAARGMSYEGFLVAYDWANDLSEMGIAAITGKRISNHSYGQPTGFEWDQGTGWHWYGDPQYQEADDFGYYSDLSEQWDNFLYSQPYFIACVSAGNDREDTGPTPGGQYYIGSGTSNPSTDPREPDGGDDGFDCISDRGVSKNTFSIGAVNDIQTYYGPGSVNVTGFSSFGPTDDGRIKPDVVANGQNLLSTWNTNTQAYQSISGTSMSSPSAAGALNLLFQLYVNTYGDEPLASTLKGVVIHTTDEAGNWDGPDYRYGWGLMNTLAAADLIMWDDINPVAIQEVDLAEGETYQQEIVMLPDQPLRVTIMWTDPAGNAISPWQDHLNVQDPMLVNDLDVRVIEQGTQTTYFPYVLGGLDNPGAEASTGDNMLDNVEQIYIADVPDGQYTIEVSHKNTLDNAPQTFSLLITGAIDANDPRLSVTNLEADLDYGDGTVTLTWQLDNPGPTFQYYEIYRDGQSMGTTTDFSYTSEFPTYGEYEFEVRAVYDEGESLVNPTIDVYFAEPVAANYLGYYPLNQDLGEIRIGWNQARVEELAFDDGTGENPGMSFTASVDPGQKLMQRFTMPEIGSIQDISIDFGAGQDFGEVELQIRESTGDNFIPGDVIWNSEPVMGSVVGWNTFDVTPRVTVEPGEEYWIGLEWLETGLSEVRIDHGAETANRGVIYSNVLGDWGWYPLSEFANGTWDGDPMIRINFGDSELPGEFGLQHFAVYRDGSEIGTTQNLFFDDTLPGNDVYEYEIEAVYAQGSVFSDVLEVDGNNLGVADREVLPVEFAIGEAYPNPFNPSVAVPVTLGAGSEVKVTVYDLLGRQVATINPGKLSAGQHTVSWTADGVASGVYFMNISAGPLQKTQKVVLMR